MPPVIFSSAAVKNLELLRDFLRLKNPKAPKRAAQAIVKAMQVLGQHPQLRRPEGTAGTIWDLPIMFGKSGYVARYAFDGNDIEILAIRHMREVGF